MSLQGGDPLGPCVIVSPLGAGGMGEVYRARDTRLAREVALKVLPAAVRADPDRLRRFEQEARAAGGLNHPNVLVVHDAGVHEGTPYLATELLEGQTLRERLSHGPLPWRKAVDCGTQVAAGLAAAHDKGIVHRDLKPENLFVTEDGRIKILDFGLARATQGEASGQESTLAAVERGYAILNQEPAALGAAGVAVPPAVEQLVRRYLEKQPDERFGSARDLGFAFSDGQATMGVFIRSTDGGPPVRVDDGVLFDLSTDG